MTTRKPARLLSTSVAAMLILAACAGQGGPPPSLSATPTGAAPTSQSGAPSAASLDWKKYSGTEITFLADQHPWTDGMTPLLAQFTQETGIKVNVQPFAEDLYFDKMSLAIKSPTGTADVYFMPDGTSYDQFLAGDVEPLSPYLNDPTKTAADYNLKDFPAGFLGSMYPPGDPNAQLYGIPISFETYILFYNKDLVNKYLGGVLPKTMDELTAAAAKVTKDGAKDGVTGSVMRGIRSADSIMDTFSGVVFDSWGSKAAPSPYGMWFDGAWTKPRLTDPLICAGITNYAKMVAAGPSNKFALDWPDASSVFSQGKAAFYIDASLFSPSFEDAKKSQVAGKVGYVPLPPTTAGGTSYSGNWTWSLAIPKNAKNKDAAWYFIQWMTNKANTAKIGASTGGAPRLSAYSDPTYTSKLVPDYVSAVNTSMQTTRATSILKGGWSTPALAIVDGMLAIANGGDPTASCAAANTALLTAINALP